MKKLFLFGGFFLIVAAATFLASRYTGQKTTNVIPTPATNNPSSWSSLTPEKSTEEDVIEQLGNPTNITYKNNESTYQYQTTLPNIYNEVTIENRSVSVIKEQLTTEEPLSLRLKDFPAASRLYTPDSDNGMFFIVAAEQGIGFLGNIENDTLYEVWHFKPESLPFFLTRSYAKDFSERELDTERF
jgi:hypothetical protein